MSKRGVKPINKFKPSPSPPVGTRRAASAAGRTNITIMPPPQQTEQTSPPVRAIPPPPQTKSTKTYMMHCCRDAACRVRSRQNTPPPYLTVRPCHTAPAIPHRPPPPYLTVTIPDRRDAACRVRSRQNKPPARPCHAAPAADKIDKTYMMHCCRDAACRVRHIRLHAWASALLILNQRQCEGLE